MRLSLCVSFGKGLSLIGRRGGAMIGERLGKYTILKSMGTGSMGTVYKAEDNEDGRTVALKLIRSQVLYSRERRERFLQCLLAASEVRHKGICPILEIGDDNDDFFVVMPFIEGRTLEQYLERRPLSWQSALPIGIAVAEALEAAHSTGAIHRGLKLSNVWIHHDGAILVTDCGLARFTEIAKRSGGRCSGETSDFAETLVPIAALAYMSPEQIRGEVVDQRTDIFSFGALLYEMLTGRHPFDAQSSLSRMSAILEADPPAFSSKTGPIPPKLKRAVCRALAKDPKDRLQSMSEVLAELRAVRDNELTERAPDPEPRRDSRLKPGTLWWLALALLLLICAVVAFILARA